MSDSHLPKDRREGTDDELVAGFPRDVATRALEENLWDLWRNIGLAPGCTLYDDGGAVWFDTPIPTVPYNTVLKFVVDRQPDRRIDALVDHYQRRNVPFLWFVHPTTRPTDLGDRLLARGLLEAELVSGMVANLVDLPEPSAAPPGFEIHEANDETEARHVFDLVAWRWDVPPEALFHHRELNKVFRVGTPEARVRCWLACRDGIPLSKVVLNCAGRVAGLHGVATKPEARRLGLAGTLALEALRAARQEGYEMGVLHSTPMAVSMYARLGFQVAAPFKVFASQAVHI